jgi:hypothetical protein
VILFAIVFAGTSCIVAQTSAPSPSPEVRKWDIFEGDWVLSGTAQDAPTGTTYKVDWTLHEHWILGGFFMQVDQVWKRNGQESHALEILSYDPVRKVHTSSGYASDGSAWNLTASFRDNTVIEESVSQNPAGQPTTCHTTFVFSADHTSLSGTQECEENGARWTAFRVKGNGSRKKSHSAIAISEKRMAGTTRLELATSAVTGQRSNQLNYVPTEGESSLVGTEGFEPSTFRV